MTLLARALAANGLFSCVSGLLCVAGARPVAGALGDVPAWAVGGAGVGLLAFAAFVFTQVRRPNRRAVLVITGSDGVWVAGSAVLLALQPEWLTPRGELLVLTAAGPVLAFAVLQILGLRGAPAFDA